MEYAPDSGYLLTIVVPLYNEQENLVRLARELTDYLSLSSYKASVLFVNDGSKDQSAEFIEQYCTLNPAYDFIELKTRSGLSAALRAGIDQVKTRYTGYMDADLQTSPFDFDLLMPFAADYELVTGIRENRKDTLVKRISSYLANQIRQRVTHDGVSDTGCPLKVFHTATARRILLFNGMHRFLPALVQLDGGRVKMVPVRHYARVAGRSNYHLSNRLIGPAIDLMAFAWIKKRYIRYHILNKG